MKDFMMLVGFGAGLVSGMLIYKYSSCTRKAVEKSEKTLQEGAEKLEKQVAQEIKKVKNKVKQNIEPKE